MIPICAYGVNNTILTPELTLMDLHVPQMISNAAQMPDMSSCLAQPPTKTTQVRGFLQTSSLSLSLGFVHPHGPLCLRLSRLVFPVCENQPTGAVRLQGFGVIDSYIYPIDDPSM